MRRAFVAIDGVLGSDVLPDASNLASEFIETFWDDPQALDLMPERSRARAALIRGEPGGR